MRYEYNKLNMKNREKVFENDYIIKYEPSEEEKNSFQVDEFKSIYCTITGKDILSKNVNYIYSKIINKIKEIYNEDMQSYLDKNYKYFVKQEIKNVILKSGISKKELKKDGVTSEYNIVNLIQRIKEVEYKNLFLDMRVA